MSARNDIKKILIIGSGPIIIGQACEFDYSGTQACKALKKLGYQIVLVNSNPATIMTDPEMADITYIEPLNIDTLTKIIEKERPDALLPNLGGQTGLNLSLELNKKGVLDKYSVKVIGVNIDAIERGEDRIEFKNTMKKLGIGMPKSEAVYTIEEAERVASELGYPVVIRPAYTMGGTGGGHVYNVEELRTVASRGLSASIIGQILIEESVFGWEELELEVVRDSKNQMITVCFIENVDPMGVHTGDSFCTAPMLTISKELQNKLQELSYKIVEAIEVIGGTNIQFAHNPKDGRIVIIEINPRTSRSSALASKATGFPIALISAQLATGITLDELPYWKDGTLNKYIPSGDYVVVKFPRWAFEKFKNVEDKLGTQMRAVGEVMSIGKNFKEAFGKALRSLENGRYGLGFAKQFNKKTKDELLELLTFPSSERYYIIYEAIRKGATIDEINKKTFIKEYFLTEIKELVDIEEEILKYKGKNLPDELLKKAKENGFSDKYIALLISVEEEKIRNKKEALGIKENWQIVPVSGTEKGAYYYSTYLASDEVSVDNKKKVMILGGGPNRIGQGIEFDYCCVHAAFELKRLGYEPIMINCNPETVSTDYDTSDKLYFEPLTVEDVLSIYKKENPIGVIVQFGGQTPLNIAKQLEEEGVNILGTSCDSIDLAEDRERFSEIMNKLNIPMPKSGMAGSLKDAEEIANKIGYPLIVRPSYVLGGRGMEIVHEEKALIKYVENAIDLSPERPILIDKFLENAVEAEADAISDGTNIFIPSIMEHIEYAGIHSGDSACVIPPITLSEKIKETIRDYTKKIAIELKVTGLINIQFAVYNDTVFVLEANPRASRTVPLVSKVCNIYMAKIATGVMVSKKITDYNLTEKPTKHFGVKEAVFPFNMFTEVDPLLGPEMRSTGEVLGMADNFGLAFYKAQVAAKQSLPLSGNVLLSVSKRERPEVLKVANEFIKLNFKIYATEGTRDFLKENGIESELIYKLHEDRPNINDRIINGEIHLIINTPLGILSEYDDSFIRKNAIRYGIPYITTIAAGLAAAKGIEMRKKGDMTVKSLQNYNR